jgi:hypothetical protein
MTFKFQLSPETSTRAIRMRAIPERWVDGYGCSREMGFLRSWFEDDSDDSDTKARRGMNWGAISGLVISLAISGGFWAGIGLLIARIVR